MKPITTALALALLSLSLHALHPVSSQPTWDLRVEILPSELYMGEWGTIPVNITNVDCSWREFRVLEFKGIAERELEAFLERAELMKEIGFIEDYSYTASNLRGFGGEIYGDYVLNLRGVCGGRKITVVGAGLWFPWSGYGRGVMDWRTINVELDAYDPVEVILSGRDPSSSILVEFRFLIPHDLPPEEMETWPKIDVRLVFPGWMEYTLGDIRVIGSFQIQPYRTFNLTLTNYGGDTPLAGAKIVMKELMHYYKVRKLIMPENGTVKIVRLHDVDYHVAVYWNSTYTNRTEVVVWETYSAYELASSGVLKTKLYNLRIEVEDMAGRPLNDARVVFDDFEKAAVNGSATYPLVPTGNYSVQVYWMGVKVYDGWLWAGYHPTIFPWMTRPARVHRLKLPVADLVVQAVDTGGNPVGANFTVRGPSPKTSFTGIYARSGLLQLTQLPVADYGVEAFNRSKVFGVEVSAEGVFRPGETGALILPIHSFKLWVKDAGGEPLEGAVVELAAAVNASTGRDGSTGFSGVPAGTYGLKVYWRGVGVYEGEVRVEGDVEKTVSAQVYDISLRLVDAEGEEYLARVVLSAPGGYQYVSRNPVKEVEAHKLPEGDCLLSVSRIDGRPLLNLSMTVSELAGLRGLKLPVADMRVEVRWSDDKPLEAAKIEVRDLETGEGWEGLTDANGSAVFPDTPFSNYTIHVRYPYTPILLRAWNASFTGQPFRVEVMKAGLRVSVEDMLGNPVEDAEVSVYYGPIMLAKRETDASGLAVFERLPALAPYTVKARYGSSETEEKGYPDGVVELRLQYISFPAGAEAGALLPLITLIGVLTFSAALIVLVVRHVRSKLGGWATQLSWP